VTESRMSCESGQISGTDPGGRLGRSPSLKPMKVTFFTMILYNSENSICDIRLFCHPLFCHSNVVKQAR